MELARKKERTSNEDRFSRYFCNKCNREYIGCPKIGYENPNEELGEGVILIEKGEYQCKICNGLQFIVNSIDSKNDLALFQVQDNKSEFKMIVLQLI
ncbi:MAG: hypothetical protein WA364_23415 [Candidatus Nitrosopolaris sp.]